MRVALFHSLTERGTGLLRTCTLERHHISVVSEPLELGKWEWQVWLELQVWLSLALLQAGRHLACECPACALAPRGPAWCCL